jgi:hypothetical protein
MKKIPLTNGGFVTVDDDDYEYLSEFSWRGKKSDGGKQRHAVRDVRLGSTKITVRMHRLITESGTDDIVHHVNGNGLDNRKRNLQARPIRPWTSRAADSAYRGVKDLGANMFESKIKFTDKWYPLGVYESPKEAALIYDVAARDLYGSSARTNF